MRQKLLRERRYIKIFLSILISLCLGMGAMFVLSFSAYAEEGDNTPVIEQADPDEAESTEGNEGGEVNEDKDPAPEDPEAGAITLEISVDGGGWVCKNYKRVDNSILVKISDSTADRTKISYNVYSGSSGSGVMNLNNFHTNKYGIIDDSTVLKALNNLGAGTYSLQAKYEGSEAWTTFEVSNGWKSEPHVIEWTYGDYNNEINPIRISAEALDGAVSYTVLNEDETVIEGLQGFFEVNDEVATELKNLNAGAYYLHCEAIGLTENVEFSVHQIENKWKVIPSLTGWSEGGYDSKTNVFNGAAEQGTVKFTVKDTKGKTLYIYNSGKLYDAQGGSVSIKKLNDLSAGTYTLVAEIEGTVNYSSLKAEVQFSVLENRSVHGGIIAATICFAVIDLVAAGVCVFFIIMRRRKVEEQFNKMVSKELHRR